MVTPEKFIDLIIAKSADLRAAGILELSFSDCSVTFSPAGPTIKESLTVDNLDDSKPGQEDYAHDPLSDPSTFGINDPDALAPGFTRQDLDS